MIEQIGYMKRNGHTEVEFKCHKISEYDMEKSVCTTDWCIGNCPFALRCSMVEKLIDDESMYGMPEHKKAFMVLRQLADGIDAELGDQPM